MSYRSVDASVARLVDLQCKKWELSQLKLTGQFGAEAAKSEAEAEKAYADRQGPAAKGNTPKN